MEVPFGTCGEAYRLTQEPGRSKDSLLGCSRAWLKARSSFPLGISLPPQPIEASVVPAYTPSPIDAWGHQSDRSK
jgi:hypothetical protein